MLVVEIVVHMSSNTGARVVPPDFPEVSWARIRLGLCLRDAAKSSEFSGIKPGGVRLEGWAELNPQTGGAIRASAAQEEVADESHVPTLRQIVDKEEGSSGRSARNR